MEFRDLKFFLFFLRNSVKIGALFSNGRIIENLYQNNNAKSKLKINNQSLKIERYEVESMKYDDKRLFKIEDSQGFAMKS